MLTDSRAVISSAFKVVSSACFSSQVCWLTAPSFSRLPSRFRFSAVVCCCTSRDFTLARAESKLLRAIALQELSSSNSCCLRAAFLRCADCASAISKRVNSICLVKSSNSVVLSRTIALILVISRSMAALLNVCSKGRPARTFSPDWTQTRLKIPSLIETTGSTVSEIEADFTFKERVASQTETSAAPPNKVPTVK